MHLSSGGKPPLGSVREGQHSGANLCALTRVDPDCDPPGSAPIRWVREAWFRRALELRSYWWQINDVIYDPAQSRAAATSRRAAACDQPLGAADPSQLIKVGRSCRHGWARRVK